MHYFILVATLSVMVVHVQSNRASTGKLYPKSFINPYPRFKAYHDGDDPGEPLFLTPLIEKKKIDEARSKSKVVDSQFLSVESYAGYLTVDKHYNSNLFFWYFPAEIDPANASVVLWLQGGPGASSLFGLFTENGPFEFDNSKLKKREMRWNRKMNLIYIDNPVGTGFSFTDDDAGYSRNEKQVGHNLYEAMRQLFTLFDFSKTKGLYITGESYGGKYVPALAYYTHHAQLHDDVVIPLKGIAIGNGFSDPLHQLNYGDYLYQLGLIDFNGLEEFRLAEKKGTTCIKKHDMECAFNVFDNLIDGDETPNGESLFRQLTGFETYFNYIQTKPNDADTIMGQFLQSSLTRRAIHVGNKTFHDLDGENKVEKFLKNDIMDSVAPWVAELLNHYKVCIYNGQLDIIVAYPLTLTYLQHLKFNGSEEYKKADRTIWRVDNEIAGYKKEAGNLLEVLVRNAGHMVPMDQPKWMFDLISTFTESN